ncbi:MAG: hypothetical protein J1F22_01085 [Lachnospiraceae bacterium]|nr:hypothetical protein [Lachnospiraceae bacterium]
MKEKFAQMIIRNDSLVQAPNDIISGYARGYYTVIQFMNNSSVPVTTININAKEGSYAPAVPMQQYLTELKTTNKRILSANYIDSRIEISLRRPNLLKNVPETVTEILDEVWNYLSRNGYISCCGLCGKEEASLSLCSVQGRAHYICPDCGTQNEQILNAAREEESRRPINYVTGIVGAFVGVLIGVILWIVFYQMGFIAGIAGAVMMICSFKGFELLGGRINIAGIIICIVLDFVAVYFAHNISVAVSMMQEVEEYSFSTAYQSISFFIEYSSEFAEAYWHDLIMGYALAAIGIIPSLVNYIKGAQAQYEYKKLS